MEMHSSLNVTADDANGFPSLPGSSEVDRLLAELVENGVVVLPPLVSPDTLRDMQQEGLVRLTRGQVMVLDLERLRDAAEG